MIKKTLQRVRWTRVYNLVTAAAIGLLAWGYMEQSDRLSELEQSPLGHVQLQEIGECFFDARVR